MNALELQELESLLRERRHELVSMLEMLNQQIVAKIDCAIRDAAEAASLQEDNARAKGIADQYSHTISEIDHALRKFKSGHYGFSEKSGEPIAYQRLLLIPWARTAADD